MDADNGRVDNANFKQYGETTVTSGAGTTYTVNLATGNSFKLTLAANCAITFANPLTAGTANIFTIMLVQDGGSRSVTWPAAVKWASGTAPTLATAAGAIDTITFMTVDGGTRYFGFPANSTTTALAASSAYNLFAWGSGARGGLGLFNGNANVSSPVQVGTLSHWMAGAKSYGAGFAVKSDNTLWVWGNNISGQLGLGDTVYRSSPTQLGALSAWSSVASSNNATMFIKADGALWATGANGTGKLGVGDTVQRSSPVQVGTLSVWASVSVGPNHTAAVKTDGTLWSWGQAFRGSLGLGDAVNRSTPTQIGTLNTWTSVVQEPNGYRAMALKTDGTIWGWGQNYNGGLGTGDTIHRSSPVQVGTLATWSVLAAGQGNTFAITTNGTLWSWGQNGQGSLGLGDGVYRSSPTQVGTLSSWQKVGGSAYDTLAIRSDNTLWGMGQNSLGVLGLGDTVKRSSPVQVTSATGWVQVVGSGGSAGNSFAFQDLSLRTGRTLWVWGANAYGELGLGDRVYRSAPTQIPEATTWSGVSGGQVFRLGVKNNGTLWAWGRNNYGQLGQNDAGSGGSPSATSRSSPVQVGTLTDWAKVFTGNYNAGAFAIKTSGTLWSWGSNSGSILGDSGGNRSSPTQVGTLANWSFVSSGRFSSTLAVKTDGTLWAWGSGSNGILGLGDTASRVSPVQVGTLATWSNVSVSANVTIAVKTNGTLWAWGVNADGQLGNFDSIYRSSPVQIGTLTTWSQVVNSAGQSFTALKTDGTIWSWGRNGSGQLGVGDVISRSSPTQAGTLTSWTGISGGFNYVMAGVQTNGTIWMWGANTQGSLGLSGGGSRSTPTQIGAFTDWSLAGTVLGPKWSGQAFRAI